MKKSMGMEKKALARDVKNAMRAMAFDFWNWSAVGGVISCPRDQALLNAPDHAPDVEQHHPANSATDADGEQAIAFPSMIVPVEKKPGSNDDHDRVNHRKDWAFVQHAFPGNETGIKNCPDDGPNQKEPAHDCAGAAAAVAGVRAHDIAPIG